MCLCQVDFGNGDTAIRVHNNFNFPSRAFEDEEISARVHVDTAAGLFLNSNVDKGRQLFECNHALVAKPDGIATRAVPTFSFCNPDVERLDLLGEFVDSFAHVMNAIVQVGAQRGDALGQTTNLFGKLISLENG